MRPLKVPRCASTFAVSAGAPGGDLVEAGDAELGEQRAQLGADAFQLPQIVGRALRRRHADRQCRCAGLARPEGGLVAFQRRDDIIDQAGRLGVGDQEIFHLVRHRVGNVLGRFGHRTHGSETRVDMAAGGVAARSDQPDDDHNDEQGGDEEEDRIGRHDRHSQILFSWLRSSEALRP